MRQAAQAPARPAARSCSTASRPTARWFRRRFGIDNEQALELFHQTVSMKSVGNLTDFVRSHMLEPFDVAPRIAALIAHFDDLNRAHEAVLKAKRQVELLTPLVADCERHAELAAEVEALRACREALQAYFAGHKLALLDQRLASLTDELAPPGRAQCAALDRRRREQQAPGARLRRAIADNGGDRLERLAVDIRAKQNEREQRQRQGRALRRAAHGPGLLAGARRRGLPGPARPAPSAWREPATARGRAAERADRTGREPAPGRSSTTS